jgi:hypothetical protein
MHQAKNYDVIVVGGGFAGIYSAWKLVRGGRKVALLESTDNIGGNLKSITWKNFSVDNGTHNLDMRSPAGQEFYADILGDQLQIFEDQQWACTVDKEWTYGFETPDFSFDTKLSHDIMEDMRKLKEGNVSDDVSLSYAEAYKKKYGEKLYSLIKGMIKKYTDSSPDEFAIESQKFMGMFSRVRLGSDGEMIALKEASEFWNERLGVTLNCGDKRFIGLNSNKKFGYPRSGGLMTLCNCAMNRLSAYGVDVITNCEVREIKKSADGLIVSTSNREYYGRNVFWTLADSVLCKILKFDIDLNQYAIPVGNCFVAFETDVSNILGPDYLHDWSNKRQTFRYNKQGVYSNQITADGTTFVVAEMPTHPSRIKDKISTINNSEIWAEMRNIGFVKSEATYVDYKIWGHPFVFAAPKVGWKGPYDAYINKIGQFSGKLQTIEFGYRGRLAFMRFYDEVLHSKF